MSIVDIPFTEDMAQLSLEGRKHATSRTKKYGDPGDTFFIKDMLLEITSVSKWELLEVYWFGYKAEGFDSSEAFEAKWIKLHPRTGFVPEQKVWFHEYRKVL